jgi:hypothetical protein
VENNRVTKVGKREVSRWENREVERLRTAEVKRWERER